MNAEGVILLRVRRLAALSVVHSCDCRGANASIREWKSRAASRGGWSDLRAAHCSGWLPV